MPELPEVETIRRGLEAAILGRRLSRVNVVRRDLRLPVSEGIGPSLAGRRIVTVGRKGKYLLLGLDSKQTLIIHLGMSGRIILTKGRNAPPGKHEHIFFDLDDGGGFTFADPRRFGLAVLADDSDLDTHVLLGRLGIDPLSQSFDEPYLIAAAKGRRAPLKALLLDQHVIAGLGNIYVSEALHRARISPKRTSRTLGPGRAQRLVPEIRAVLHEAIEAGGSSLRDYVRSTGELGYFQHSFRVYDREGEPCLRESCDGKVRRIVQSNRSTFYCPACQR